MKPCQHLSGKGRDDGLGAGEYDSVVGWCQLASLRIAVWPRRTLGVLGTCWAHDSRHVDGSKSKGQISIQTLTPTILFSNIFARISFNDILNDY